jgi:branched-chain amino acid transport system substrate-binding protein
MPHARRLFAVGILAAPLVCGSAQAEVTIAVAAPITGPFAILGDQVKRGAEMAVKDINAQGGVLNQTVSLIVGDDICEPEKAVQVARDLASKKVRFVAGHLCSSASIAASEIYAKRGILMISPVSTNPTLTEAAFKKGWRNVFRVSGRDDAQGIVAGRYLAKEYKGQPIAILHDGSAYGKGLAAATRKSLRAAGGREAMYVAYAASQKSFGPLIAKMKSAGVAAVYVGGQYVDAGAMIRQAHEQGFKPKLISGDVLVNPEFWKISGPAGEGTLMTYLPDQRKNTSAKSVVARFVKERYDPKGYTLYAYAAVQVWAMAAKRAKSLELPAISQTLRRSPFETVIGKLSFDRKGDVKDPDYAWYVWKGGRYVEQ